MRLLLGFVVRFRLNLPIQTLFCSLLVGIVLIPQHAETVTDNILTGERNEETR